MNFYKGTKIEILDQNEENAYLSNNVIEYIYKMEDELDVNVDALNKISLSTDTVIENEDLREIIEIFESVLDSEILEDYDDNAIDDLEVVLEFFIEAEEEFINIIAICDQGW